MKSTTIRIQENTKELLTGIKTYYKLETYNQTIQTLYWAGIKNLAKKRHQKTYHTQYREYWKKQLETRLQMVQYYYYSWIIIIATIIIVGGLLIAYAFS